ncbi:molybdopterin cofactor-binding domain-containing protein [Dyella subtropica]|uniref:molybdopterin cofactor-binding domain-containing protein n=1 Tax=Dyella subtropica TaxID=2992127 RepID=UPI002250AEA4|nr:molybdopterin cofactor-binding domain-containing protein [Dyella subtropica]
MSSIQAIEQARATLAEANNKLEKLRNLEPYLIDLSLRENPVGSNVGQILADKLDILPKLRAFGFKNISLGTLDYAMPDELEVDDDFMMHLRDRGIDMSGCFAFTALGIEDNHGAFKPDPSQLKLRDYGVPNTVHEIYLSKEGMAGQYDLETLRRSLPASIRWLRENIRGDDGGAPRILINIVDGCDAFAENLEDTCEILSLLAEQPIEGVTIEDDRGTYLPFQVGAFVAVARSLLPQPLKILVHIHSGAGFENASVIEALLNGADGVWGGLPKRAAIIGHASLGELIANLVRVGNPHMRDAYRLEQLLPLATGFQTLDENGPVPDDLPILGHNAYRLTYSGFAQCHGRFMDLPPEAIGGAYGYRVCPQISDEAVIAGRLAEVTGRPAKSFPDRITRHMIRLMRRDLRAGLRIAYDEPGNLLALLARASADSAAPHHPPSEPLVRSP